MTDKSNKPAEAAKLRQQAEKQFAEKAGLRQPTHKPLSPEESQAALHELEVHQIELEIQNDELRQTQLELDAVRKRYFDLYDLAPVGYCTISEKGVILEANLTAASLLGVSRLEMTESPFSHFIRKEDQDSLYLHHRRLFAGDDKQDFDLRMLKTDGTVFWAHLTETQAHDAAGLPVAHIALTDISDTKQFEEALRKSERNLHLILDSTAEAIYGIDTNGDCTFCNRACLEILGYKNPDELIGKNMHWQIHSMHADGTPLSINECHIFRAFKTGEGTHVSDEVLWRADGTSFPAEYWSYPQYENYVVTGAVVTFINITERKKAAEELLDSKQMFVSFLDYLPAIAFLKDHKGRTLFVNKYMETTLGASKWIGKTMLDIFPNKFGAKLLADDMDVLKSGYMKIEESIPSLDGTSHDYETQKFVIPGPDQEPLLGGISLDFTERKRLQKQEKALQQQAQTSARLAAIGEMASGIAHEINNPLTSVVGFSELLLEEDLPPKIKDQLKIIAEGSHRVKEIIKNMLTFAHQTKPCKTLSNINLLIDSTLNLRSYVLKTSNIEVNKHFDPDLPWILVDPGQIQQVFLNIMVNAEWEMKKAHGRGTMTITTKNMGDHVRITFKDDGRGMNEEILAKLFNPFFTTKPTGEGTGLGLSLSRSIILDNNGTIDVESEPGQGATFIIDLPTNPEDDTEGQQTSIESKTAPENFKGVRVLVVDDEEPIRKLAGVMLVQKGYTVESTGDAREAIEKMENTTYDVVLVDIRMPGTNGIDLYNDIKARRPELVGRLIFITGDISNENTRGFLVKNKLSYVTKPFDRGMLLQKVGSVLSSRDAGRA